MSSHTHATLAAFGYPSSLLWQNSRWAILLRPKQLTLGSLVVVSRSEATAFGALDAAAGADLAEAAAKAEGALRAAFAYDKINWLMLMMVDPHVHFHVFPRYAAPRAFAGQQWTDAAWPGPPALAAATSPDAEVMEALKAELSARLQAA